MAGKRSLDGDALGRSVLQRLRCQARGAIACLRRARQDHSSGYARLGTRFLDLYATRKYSIGEIAWLDLLDPRLTRADLDCRPSKHALLQLQTALNPREYWGLTEDKRIFDIVCRAQGLPVPRSFGTFVVEPRTAPPNARALARRRVAGLLLAAPAQDLLLKPVGGVYGNGIRFLRRIEGHYEVGDGSIRSAEGVYDGIEEDGDVGEHLVQEHVKAHAALRRLSGSRNPCTVRMVTYVTREGHVFLGSCELRIIVGASLVDNFRNGRNGNLIGTLPKAGGRVGQVFGPAPGRARWALHEKHPQTGAPFAGFEVPYWDQACRLVERAAVAMLPLRTIGWDVAITDEGPLLIEGNVTWDPANEGAVADEVLRVIRADGDLGASHVRAIARDGGAPAHGDATSAA